MKTAPNTENFSSALKPECPCIVRAVFPRLISAVYILPCGTAALSAHPVEHAFNKRMQRRFPAFIGSVNQVDPRFQPDSPVMKFSKIFISNSLIFMLSHILFGKQAAPAAHNIKLSLYRLLTAFKMPDVSCNQTPSYCSSSRSKS